MILRTLLLAASLGAGLMTAVSGYAMPITARSEAALASSTAVTDIGYREHGDDDDDREYGEHRNKHHGRHGEDHDRYAANGCGEDDDDSDDDEGCGGRGGHGGQGGGMMMQQDATPPQNGLFTPGSKPRAQMN
ncbi:MAG: hypothetical protein LCH47_04245 [Proteobacteria bacterium]|nr:hypothetical protein [Pseudomonadota bacterium]